jgi:hypothetical protein
MKYGGKPCGETSMTKACNAQACEQDCVLSRWSDWGDCSKDCDGGSQKRFKTIKEKAIGEGSCDGEWSKERLEFKKCNYHACVLPKGSPVLKCKKALDVVLLLDGSGSLGKAGWDAEIKAAQNMIKAFSDQKDEDEVKTSMSVILFSGPKTYDGVSKCTGKSTTPMSMEDCGIKFVTHFTDDMNRVNQLVLGTDWPRGSTLTSLALATAGSELNQGRKDAKSVVVVFTDGRPMSYRKTWIAARQLRKLARLVWVPITARAPLVFIKMVATRRWQENIVVATDYHKLASPTVVNHVIADICSRRRRRRRRKDDENVSGLEDAEF